MTETKRSDPPAPGGVATKVTDTAWRAVRVAILDASERFASMVDAADPLVMATADWTVADTAAHVATVAWQNTALVQSDDTPQPIPGLRDYYATTTVDNIHGGLNVAIRELFTERDPHVLADHLRGSVQQMLELTETADPNRLITWLGGARLPVAGLLAHLVNELLLHGRDIALAIRKPWPIPADQAALFFELFILGIAHHGTGRFMEIEGPPRPGRIAVEFRSAYTTPVTIVLDNGRLSLAEPSKHDDLRLYFQPADFNLLLFHRIGRPRAVLTGAVRVWGRRPWLLFAFLRTVRAP
jgi:Mycothiol maleylpyruvate isomerase N-terminal domain